ncbi:MAG: ATP-binding protein [Kofleriaceae bacterium]
MLVRRLDQLLGVAGDLAGATSRNDVGGVVERAIAAVGASYGALWIINADHRTMELVGASPLPKGDISRWNRVPLDGDAPASYVVRTNQPLFLSLGDYQARFPASFVRIAPTLGASKAGYAMIPLTANGTVLGLLGATFEHVDEIAPHDRTYLEILARQCAVSLDRIRIYETEREARKAAEAATLAREDILSVVSHDLVNPIAGIAIAASAIHRAAVKSGGEQIQLHAQRIQREAERMSRLLEDLVDFSRIQSGRLAIERAPHAPDEIIAEATDLFAPLANERGLVLETKATPGLRDIECDSQRAMQVLSNLLANAIKVTPHGGVVAVGAEPKDEDVVFFVSDTGPGIRDEDKPQLFERFWRGKEARYKGTGLGLSIARSIVDAHGGRIWVESQLGAGATFYFSLSPS